MISEQTKEGTKVFHLKDGIGEILKKNDDGTFKVKFEWFIIPKVNRKELTKIEQE